MSKPFKITLATIAALVLAGIFVPVLLPHRCCTSRLDRYLCIRCAAQRDVIGRQYLNVQYDGTDKITATVLSRRIFGGTNAECAHEWIRIYFDFHGANESGHGGVNSRLVLYLLTETEAIAAGIVSFADSMGLSPSEVWRTLFYAATDHEKGQPSKLDKAINSGRILEEPFDHWLQQNYLKLNQKSANQVPDLARNRADP